MPEPFDAFRFLSHMRSRWRWIAASAAVAVAIALAVSLAQPRLYTATARIVIDPPAGMDPRSVISPSPVYLESLKTYEQFAQNDDAFRKAVDQLALRTLLGHGPVESLKKRALKAGLVRNTRILEIDATLPDPRKAQALARFMAEATVALNRAVAAEQNRDMIQSIEQQERDLRARADAADAAWTKLLAGEPVDDLESAIQNAAALRADIERQMQAAELEGGGARARLDTLRNQIAALDRQSAERQKLLATRLARRDQAEADRDTAQEALTAIGKRLRDARSDAGYRGERLQIIDPGMVPERPSSPNIPLNLVAALLLGLVLPILYLTLEMNFEEHRSSARRSVYHAVAKARDE
ncbi:MAG: hypothetical protein LAP87_18085 [Acidobacteriia bacterium]|nr:hypothetical protein [Terriglobia bacterium]